MVVPERSPALACRVEHAFDLLFSMFPNTKPLTAPSAQSVESAQEMVCGCREIDEAFDTNHGSTQFHFHFCWPRMCFGLKTSSKSALHQTLHCARIPFDRLIRRCGGGSGHRTHLQEKDYRNFACSHMDLR